MKDEETIILIECINLNPNLSGTQKLDLVRKTMSDCREKQVGKLLIGTIERKTKKIKTAGLTVSYPKPMKITLPKKVRKKSVHSEAFIEKKKLSSNAVKMVNSVRENNEEKYE